MIKKKTDSIEDQTKAIKKQSHMFNSMLTLDIMKAIDTLKFIENQEELQIEMKSK